MRASRLFLASLTGCCLLTACGPKQVDAAAGEPTRVSSAGDAAQKTTAARQMCPVMRGRPVNPKLTVEYQGKRYAVCCPKCVSTFKADPARYAKIADAQG
ncbi:MAG: YHS domain-containing protein [Armatimonadetes bacterium]|nr:YHS domain-containing protein [Armatimonadota bacterium]